MEKITSHIQDISKADSIDSLKEPVLSALEILGRNMVDPATIKRIQETLSGVVDRMNSIEKSLSKNSSDLALGKVSSDIRIIKEDINDIRGIISNKSDKTSINEINSDIRKTLNTDLVKLKDLVDTKVELSAFNKLRSDILSRVDEQDKRLTLKADISSLNKVVKEMAYKADKKEVESALNLKVDASKINQIKEQMSSIPTKAVKQIKVSRPVSIPVNFKRSTPDKYMTRSDLITGTYNIGDTLENPTSSIYRKAYPIGFKLEDSAKLVVNTNGVYQISFIGFNEDKVCLNTPVTWLSDGIYDAAQIRQNARTVDGSIYSFQVKRTDNAKITEDIYSSDYFFIEKKDETEKENNNEK